MSGSDDDDFENRFFRETHQSRNTLAKIKGQSKSTIFATKTIEDEENKYDQKESFPIGPEKEYKVKDIPMLFIFTVIFGGAFAIAVYSLKNGDPTKYFDGYDSWGNVCGRKKNTMIPNVNFSGKDLSANKYAFHMGLIEFKNALDPLKYFYKKRKPAVICVKECPKIITNCKKLLEDSGYKNIPQMYIDDNICVSTPGVILAHKPIFSRCVPTRIIRVINKIKGSTDEKPDSNPVNKTSMGINQLLAMYAKKILTSTSDHWREICVLLLPSVGLCFVASVGLLCAARFLVVLASLGVAIGLAFSGYLWYLYYKVNKAASTAEIEERKVLQKKPAEPSVLAFINSTASLQNASASSKAFFIDSKAVDVFTYDTNDELQSKAFEEPANPTTNLIAAVLATVGSCVLIILLIYFRKHMKSIIQLFDEACYAIFCIPCVLLQPLVTMIFLLLLIFYFFTISAYIFTIEVPVVDDRMFVEYKRNETSSYKSLFAGHVVGCYIIWQFMTACEKMIVAGAVANWYYRREKLSDCCSNSRISICPTLEPTQYVIRYNLGTAAAGSLLITVTSWIRFISDYARKKVQEEGVPFVLMCLCSSVNWCCGCINEIIEFASYNAYIVAGISGASFIAGGKRALTLLIVSAATAWILNIVSSFLLFLAKFFVTILSGMIAYFHFTNTLDATAGLSDYWFPIFLVTVMSYVIARCFFNAFGNVLDTVFLCYCDDLDRNSGVSYFSTDRLKKSMNNVKLENFKGSPSRVNYRFKGVPRPSGHAQVCFERPGYVRLIPLEYKSCLQEVPAAVKSNHVLTCLSTSQYSRENSYSIDEVVLNVDSTANDQI